MSYPETSTANAVTILEGKTYSQSDWDWFKNMSRSEALGVVKNLTVSGKSIFSTSDLDKLSTERIKAIYIFIWDGGSYVNAPADAKFMTAFSNNIKRGYTVIQALTSNGFTVPKESLLYNFEGAPRPNSFLIMCGLALFIYLISK